MNICNLKIVRSRAFNALLSGILISQAALCEPLPSYRLIDLGAIGGDSSFGNDVNNAGQVTGFANVYVNGVGTTRAFIGDQNGISELVIPNATGSLGYGINENGLVTGWVVLQGSRGNAFIGNQSSVTVLNPTDGDFSEGVDINDNDVLVGFSGYSGSLDTQAVRGTINGLISYPKMYRSYLTAINNNGQVCGQYWVWIGSSSYRHAIWGDNNGLHDINNEFGFNTSWATGINDSGQIVGNIKNSSNQTQAFVRNSDGTIIWLGTSTSMSEVFDINNNGVAVGVASGHGVMRWDAVNGMVSLQSLVIPEDRDNIMMLEARATSDTGYITGVGQTGGTLHAYLLVPIPPIDNIIDNSDSGSGPTATWIPIDGEILFFIPGPGLNWSLQTPQPNESNHQGNDYYQLSGSNNNGTPEFEWTFTVPYTSDFTVEAWWPSDSNNTTNANYSVFSETGETIITMQQNTNGGTWNSLGIFTFNEGKTYRVRLSAPSGEPVSADAIRVRN